MQISRRLTPLLHAMREKEERRGQRGEKAEQKMRKEWDFLENSRRENMAGLIKTDEKDKGRWQAGYRARLAGNDSVASGEVFPTNYRGRSLRNGSGIYRSPSRCQTKKLSSISSPDDFLNDHEGFNPMEALLESGDSFDYSYYTSPTEY